MSRSRGAPSGRAQPTLDEVAELAGVSRATASRAINGSSRVSPGARAAVEGAIARLGYVPNRAAQSLVTRRTSTIGLVLSESETRVFLDPFFRIVVHGIQVAIADTELQLVLLMVQGARQHEKVERYLRQGHVDGVVLMSLHGDDPLPRALAAAGVPAVVVGRPRPDEHLPYVDADNRGGARSAVEHLRRLGRRAIATITGPLDMTAAVDRLDGYRAALGDADGDAALVEEGDFSLEAGRRALRRLLRRRPDVDAVFAANDLMALGALEALAEEGRRVPEDVAVVGFDDIAQARTSEPPLTTVRQPFAEMTRAMAELLVGRIEGRTSEDQHVVCPTELVRRASA